MPPEQLNGLIRPHHSKLLGLVRLLDSFAIFFALWLAATCYNIQWSHDYTRLGLMAMLLFTFFSEYFEVYATWRAAPLYREALRIIFTWSFCVAVLLFLGFALKETSGYSRVVLSIWILASPATIVLLHSFRREFLGLLRSNRFNTRTIAIAGCNELGDRLEATVQKMPWLGYNFFGYYDDRNNHRCNQKLAGKLVHHGGFDKLYTDAKNGKLDVVYITLPLNAEERIRNLVKKLANSTISVYFIPNLFVFDLLHARWDTLHGLPVVSIFETPFFMTDGWIKRTTDLILSLIIITLIMLPMLFIAIGIKLSSRGPIIFKQRRYGMRGEPIEIWKFRSMRVCEDGDIIKQATLNDPRITRFGAFLRRTSMDELPQFFNVLRGSMSIVGPRPHAIAHNEFYREQIPGYMLRHKVKPGITGLAQINGFRGETKTIDKMEGRIRLDLEYIRQWSLWLDTIIILKTIVYVLRGKLAY